MTTSSTEVQLFELKLDRQRSHKRFVFSLRLVGSIQERHRKLKEIRRRIQQVGMSGLNIKETRFPTKLSHRLLIVTNIPVESGNKCCTVRGALDDDLKPIISAAVEAIERDLQLNDSIVPTTPTVTPSTSTEQSLHSGRGRKQHKWAINRLRRDRRLGKQYATALHDAFRDRFPAADISLDPDVLNAAVSA